MRHYEEGGYHYVVIPSPFKTEMERWLDSNVGRSGESCPRPDQVMTMWWPVIQIIEESTSSAAEWEWHIGFRQASDAMLFKLTWVGKQP